MCKCPTCGTYAFMHVCVSATHQPGCDRRWPGLSWWESQGHTPVGVPRWESPMNLLRESWAHFEGYGSKDGTEEQ